MQVIKTETVVYEFVELSEDAKENAINGMRDINTDFEWWDCTLDDYKEILEKIGFSNVEICFSGFWSQGDGASFTGAYSYEKGALSKVKREYPTFTALHEFAEQLQLLNRQYFYSLSFELQRICHRYSHENTVNISWSECDTNADVWPSDDTDNALIECCRGFMREIYNSLENEYEYLTSDAVVIEAIESNDYLFTGDGAFYG